MKTFLKIAWRNITRNKFRSIVTIMAISFGLAALIFIGAFVEGWRSQMIRNYTDLISTHLQIHRFGFNKNMSLEKSIKDPLEIESVLKTMPQVTSFSKRIKEFVLISSSQHSSGILIIGIEPAKEIGVTELHRHINKGEFLSEGKDNKIVLGKGLLEILNVGLGDKVVIMGQAFDGSLAVAEYEVGGVLDTSIEEIDKAIALITLTAASKLFVLGDKISEFVIRTNDVFKLDDVSRNIKKSIDTAKFEVFTWKEVSPYLVQWIEFSTTFINVILLIIILVVTAGILNTSLMGVLERIREFGIMLALGTKKSQLILMVVLESLILGLIGVVIAIVLGSLVSVYFAKFGINLSSFATAFASNYLKPVIYPLLFVSNICVTSAMVLLSSIVVSIFPALKAANLKPTQAIRHF